MLYVIDATNCTVDTHDVGHMLDVVVAHTAQNVDALAIGVCHIASALGLPSVHPSQPAGSNFNDNASTCRCEK